MVNKNFLYVAPTIKLIDQTYRELKEAIEQHQGHCRNLNMIHAMKSDHHSVAASVLEEINDTQANIGKVVIITTATFIKILSMMKHKHTWRVILDEAFSPLVFDRFSLGRTQDARDDNLEYFNEVFGIDGQSQVVVPAEGKNELVKKIASGEFNEIGHKYRSLQGIAEYISNPAIRTEVANQTADRIEIVNFTTPEHFSGFHEVIFLAALFDKTILYYVWTMLYQVSFRPHAFFEHRIKRNLHVSQGRYLSVGHLLHESDNAAMYTMLRDAETGTGTNVSRGQYVPHGSRVVDRLLRTVSEYFRGQQFILQLNKKYKLTEDSLEVPESAVVTNVDLRGLNDFKSMTRIAALAITNPEPWKAQWLADRLGLEIDIVYQAFRIHTIYQAVGRILRDDQDTRQKVALVPGYQDALFLQELFQGSTWLGQVGNLPSYSQMVSQRLSPIPRQRLQDDPEYQQLNREKRSLQNKQTRGSLNDDGLARLKEINTQIASLKSQLAKAA